MGSSREEKGKGAVPVLRVWPTGEGTSASRAVSSEGIPCSDMRESPGNSPVGAGDGTNGSFGEKSGSNKRKRVEITKWMPAAYWDWDVEGENCCICRNHLRNQCIVCEAKNNQRLAVQENCPTVLGACKHAFHFHCIGRWLETRAVCPLDNSVWEVSKQAH